MATGSSASERRAMAVVRALRSVVEANRYARAARSGARLVLHSFARALRRLGLEVSGSLFLVFALFGALAARRDYHVYAATGNGVGRLIAAVCFTGVFAYFAASAFWRACQKPGMRRART